MDCPTRDGSVALLPAAEALRRFEGRQLSFSVLRPPYPALGLGTLRVLRVRDRSDGTLEIVAGYDGYERLEGSARTGRTP